MQSIDLEQVGNLLTQKILDFSDTLETHDFLEIDTFLEDQDSFKIIDYSRECAWAVSFDTVIKTPLNALIMALETGKFINCLGITRIVGYYSRITNWNKSKIGELQDRHRGTYSVKHKYVEHADAECTGNACKL